MVLHWLTCINICVDEFVNDSPLSGPALLAFTTLIKEKQETTLHLTFSWAVLIIFKCKLSRPSIWGEMRLYPQKYHKQEERHMQRHIFLPKKILRFHDICWKYIKSQLDSLEEEDWGFISSRDVFCVVKWRVVTWTQNQDDIQSSGVYICLCLWECMPVCFSPEYIYKFSFPLEYSRVTFSLSVSGEMHFDKGVAVIVLSDSQGMKTSSIPTLPPLMGSDLIQ